MSDYDYGNARLHAMKSRLLRRDDLEALAEIRSLDGLITALAKTGYQHAIEAVIVGTSGMATIDQALRLDLTETLGKVRTFFSGRAREMITVLLGRYDLHNLKTVLRGLSKHAPPDEIEAALIPVGELTANILAELIRTAEPRSAIDVLASMRLPAARPLLTLRAEHPGATLPDMELALNRWYVEQAHRHPLEDTLLAALNFDADVSNLLTALRFAHAPIERQILLRMQPVADIHHFFVEQGRLPLALLYKVAEQNTVDDAVELLARTNFEPVLRTGLAVYKESRHLSDLEKPLMRWRLRWLATLVIKDPLGIGVALSYSALKTNEVSNIRWIAQGINIGLDTKKIKHELEIVA